MELPLPSNTTGRDDRTAAPPAAAPLPAFRRPHPALRTRATVLPSVPLTAGPAAPQLPVNRDAAGSAVSTPTASFPLDALPSLALPSIWEDLVHTLTWEAGRGFGKSMFNLIIGNINMFCSLHLGRGTSLIPSHVCNVLLTCHAGFQAFNLNPATKGYQQKQYVPATLFLVSDHLQVTEMVSVNLK